jgi:hypothetical protein
MGSDIAEAQINMYVWDYKGISVTYLLLDPQREVAVLRVDRFPT